MTQDVARPIIRGSVLALMIFQVCALFARSRLDLSLVSSGVDREIASDLSYLIVPPILLFLMAPYFRQSWAELRRLLRPADLSVRLLVHSVLLGVLLRVVYWASLAVLVRYGVVSGDSGNSGNSGNPADYRDAMSGLVPGSVRGFGCPPTYVLLLSFCVMSFLTPIIEELVHRGFILHALLPRGVIMSVILSAGLFAVVHQPGTYVWAFLVGLLLAVQLLSTRTLWAPILTHAAHNAAATFHWDCLRFVWNPTASGQDLAAVAIAAPIAAVCTGLCVWLASRK